MGGRRSGHYRYGFVYHAGMLACPITFQIGSKRCGLAVSMLNSRCCDGVPSQSVCDAIRVSAEIMGYSCQEEAVRRFVEGRDVFVSFPTGGGKSLCYSVLPLVFDKLRKTAGQSLVIAVSPLIALMKDQVRTLAERNVRAVYVEGESEFGAVCDGKYQLMFFSPETLLRSLEVREMLLNAVFQNNLVAVAVDEAHCVKKWLVTEDCCACFMLWNILRVVISAGEISLERSSPISVRSGA